MLQWDRKKLFDDLMLFFHYLLTLQQRFWRRNTSQTNILLNLLRLLFDTDFKHLSKVLYKEGIHVSNQLVW